MSAFEQARQHYLERYEEWRPSAPEPAWQQALRREALEHFAARGIPTTRLEEWRYTNLRALAEVAFRPSEAEPALPTRDAVEAACSPVFACSLFVYVNGRFAPSLSAAESLARESCVASLAAGGGEGLEGDLGRLVDGKQHPLAALATAFLEDGAVVRIPRGRELEQPIHLVFVSTGEGSLSCPRVWIRAEEGSRATVIQDHVSLDAGRLFTNVVTEVSVGAGAGLDLVLLQREGPEVFHVSNLQAELERDARFASHTFSFGGALVRNDLGALLAGEGGDCELNGLFFGSAEQLLDNHTLVDHALPHGSSRELYKGILAERARGVFRGRVVVRPDAQKTNAQQSNPNLLISEGAEIDTKPQLEIHADDVKCSHGSTIGRLDEEALFYLRSRGLPEALARDLLTRGFAAEVLERIHLPPLGETLGELLMQRLHGGAPR